MKLLLSLKLLLLLKLLLPLKVLLLEAGPRGLENRGRLERWNAGRGGGPWWRRDVGHGGACSCECGPLVRYHNQTTWAPRQSRRFIKCSAYGI